jgi:hypothetical protein
MNKALYVSFLKIFLSYYEMSYTVVDSSFEPLSDPILQDLIQYII